MLDAIAAAAEAAAAKRKLDALEKRFDDIRALAETAARSDDVTEIKGRVEDIQGLADFRRDGWEKSSEVRADKHWHRRAQEIVKPLLEVDPDTKPVDLRRAILGDSKRGIPGDPEFAKIRDRPADPVSVEKYCGVLKKAWPSSPPWSLPR
jgi:hypothetical protein